VDTLSVLKEKLLARCKHLDFKDLAKDLAPFLFIPADAKKVLLFNEYIKNLW